MVGKSKSSGSTLQVVGPKAAEIMRTFSPWLKLERLTSNKHLKWKSFPYFQKSLKAPYKIYKAPHGGLKKKPFVTTGVFPRRLKCQTSIAFNSAPGLGTGSKVAPMSERTSPEEVAQRMFAKKDHGRIRRVFCVFGFCGQLRTHQTDCRNTMHRWVLWSMFKAHLLRCLAFHFSLGLLKTQHKGTRRMELAAKTQSRDLKPIKPAIKLHEKPINPLGKKCLILFHISIGRCSQYVTPFLASDQQSNTNLLGDGPVSPHLSQSRQVKEEVQGDPIRVLRTPEALEKQSPIFSLTL